MNRLIIYYYGNYLFLMPKWHKKAPSDRRFSGTTWTDFLFSFFFLLPILTENRRKRFHYWMPSYLVLHKLWANDYKKKKMLLLPDWVPIWPQIFRRTWHLLYGIRNGWNVCSIFDHHWFWTKKQRNWTKSNKFVDTRKLPNLNLKIIILM